MTYCLSAHSYLGKHVAKLSDNDILASRRATASDPKAAAALRFARVINETAAPSAMRMSSESARPGTTTERSPRSWRTSPSTC